MASMRILTNPPLYVLLTFVLHTVDWGLSLFLINTFPYLHEANPWGLSVWSLIVSTFVFLWPGFLLMLVWWKYPSKMLGGFIIGYEFWVLLNSVFAIINGINVFMYCLQL